jgi:SAM-dependent MidA family methyltransferase
MCINRMSNSNVFRLQGSWLTPSELFTPVYGQAVARYILRQHAKRDATAPLCIAEIGAGQGTLAADILVRIGKKAQRGA